jgi:hypothetical protein
MSTQKREEFHFPETSVPVYKPQASHPSRCHENPKSSVKVFQPEVPGRSSCIRRKKYKMLRRTQLHPDPFICFGVITFVKRRNE